jgi:hypothetical protein
MPVLLAAPQRGKYGGTIDREDETTSSEIPAGASNASDQKMVEQYPTSALSSIAVMGAAKALVSDAFTIPPIFKLTIFVLLALVIIWYVYKFFWRGPKRPPTV